MPIVTDVIRPFWLAGLNDVTGNVSQSLAGWFASGKYQVYSPLQIDSFTLHVSEVKFLLSAFAYDCSRMAVVSFESINIISRNENFPKSTAWLIVQTYYAAFFAAHAIMRILGISCSQLNNSAISQIYKISSLFGQTNNIKSISQGFYVCT